MTTKTRRFEIAHDDHGDGDVDVDDDAKVRSSLVLFAV